MVGTALLNTGISTVVFLFLLPPGTEAHPSSTQLTYEDVLAKAPQVYLGTAGHEEKASALSVSLRSQPQSWGDKAWTPWKVKGVKVISTVTPQDSSTRGACRIRCLSEFGGGGVVWVWQDAETFP